ncbi:MAG: Unknown protein [uncultured Campylobacterales bacterium]|uniref:HicB-like antitoxin of toxin-antitoxin system domain-containing protein n=1 Tax=uncultured Campylobacterales bacterium TaxID=352960 RepID=A0A6S6S819_9BACT|nr:MAG: Unknown protein [uncultured Campylobacterales bacterium]
MKKNKQYYLSLDYPIVTRKLSTKEGGGILAYYVDMPNIAVDGKDYDEAIKDLKSAFGCYLDVALTLKEDIKEPSHLEKTKRINISIPLSTLNEIDKYLSNKDINRSTFLATSALNAIH